MESLKTGQFYGQTNDIIHLNGITLTDTAYTHDTVDWHYHENAYFTFILEGRLLEGNKKETYHCAAGSLLFHNWQEAHYNTKPKGFTRGFHIELEHTWFHSLDIPLDAVQGSFRITNPASIILLYQIFKETKVNDGTSSLAIQALLLEALTQMASSLKPAQRKVPLWVFRIREILQDTYAENWTLQALAQSLEIHPVHLSRDFSKYFHCTLGNYIRRMRVQRSLSLLPDRSLSLTDIALDSGFADQSHFNRCFKAMNNMTPSHFRKLLLR